MGRPECVDTFRESFDLLLRIEDRPSARAVAFSLGQAYLEVPALRNLGEAERWYRMSLDLMPEGDRVSRAALSQLGRKPAFQRFVGGREKKPERTPALLR